jgi:glycosyltransferase involved in cell wall biosynthesis
MEAQEGLDNLKLGVSVIICCYNSAERLPCTLRCLAMQRVPQGVDWEVIVVDNASTDDTANVALSEWNKHNVQGVQFSVLHQPIPGKNYAYKSGLQKAKYEFLLTCDDDNRLDGSYVANVYETMQADGLIGVLGGCGILDAETPAWNGIDTHVQSYVNGSQKAWVANAHWVYGAGSACRKKLLNNLYEKNWQQITSGRNGTKLICGEDVEICFALFLSGYKIVADDRLSFKHFVPLKRQNMKYLLNLQYWISYSYVLLNNYLMLIDKDSCTVNKKLNRWLIHTLKQLIRLLIKLAYQKLIKRIPVSDAQKLSMKANLGVISSILQNRSKILRHHKILKKIFHDGQALQT